MFIMKFELAPYHRNISDDELLADLKRVAELSGSIETLSLVDYKSRGKYNAQTFRRRFGSWKNALEKVGMQRARNNNTEIQDYWDNLKEVWIKLGRQPKIVEMIIPFSRLSGSAYLHKFGTWRNALETFVKQVNSENVEMILPDQSDVRILKTYPKSTSRQPSLRLRFLVMKRDDFKCTICGKSPSNYPGLELELDHILPWSKGGETTYENLQTLCLDCNQGKGSIH